MEESEAATDWATVWAGVTGGVVAIIVGQVLQWLREHLTKRYDRRQAVRERLIEDIRKYQMLIADYWCTPTKDAERSRKEADTALLKACIEGRLGSWCAKLSRPDKEVRLGELARLLHDAEGGSFQNPEVAHQPDRERAYAVGLAAGKLIVGIESDR